MAKADCILKNGRFLSINVNGGISRFEAAAIKDSKIIFTGSDKVAENYVHEGTKVIDLEGKMVLPGMSDSHLHASFHALIKDAVNLYGLYAQEGKNRAYYIDWYKNKLSAYYSKNPEAAMIRGVGYDPGLFTESKEGYPACFDLDDLFPDIPVILRSYCFHTAWANSKAMVLSGITKDTPNPRGGRISRDAAGNPTGFFEELPAIDLLLNNSPGYDFSVGEYKKAIIDFQKGIANYYGITQIFDALCSDNAKQAYRELAEEGNLSMRVRGCIYADPVKGKEQFNTLYEKYGKHRYGDNFQINTVKFFMDGAGPDFYMGEPFEKDYLKIKGLPENHRGTPIWKAEELAEVFPKLAAMGWQLHVHAMGDEAVTHTINAFEEIEKGNGRIGDRHVIAHLMYVKDNDKKRMGDMGIIASMQPIWAVHDSCYRFYYLPLFGEERASLFYPLGTLQKAGVRVSCGTDYPVTVPPSPFDEISAAMNREVVKNMLDYDFFKGSSMGPSKEHDRDKLNLIDIIRALTINGAWQHQTEDIAGSIEAGKYADMVVLSQNLEEVSPDIIQDTKVLMTFFEGKLVYQAEANSE